jgi:hypothetical protein
MSQQLNHHPRAVIESIALAVAGTPLRAVATIAAITLAVLVTG